MTERFTTGIIVATPAATEYAHTHGIVLADVLARHFVGDWGALGAEDRETNETQLRAYLDGKHDSGRVMSNYPRDDTEPTRACDVMTVRIFARLRTACEWLVRHPRCAWYRIASEEDLAAFDILSNADMARVACAARAFVARCDMQLRMRESDGGLWVYRLPLAWEKDGREKIG